MHRAHDVSNLLVTIDTDVLPGAGSGGAAAGAGNGSIIDLRSSPASSSLQPGLEEAVDLTGSPSSQLQPPAADSRARQLSPHKLELPADGDAATPAVSAPAEASAGACSGWGLQSPEAAETASPLVATVAAAAPQHAGAAAEAQQPSQDSWGDGDGDGDDGGGCEIVFDEAPSQAEASTAEAAAATAASDSMQLPPRIGEALY